MQLALEVIDAFRGIGHYIGGGLSQLHDVDPNTFRGAWITKPKYHLSDTELIISFPHDNVPDPVIAFSDIVPDDISSLEISDPVILRERTKSVELDSWDNAGSTEIERTASWTEQHIRTESMSIADELMVGIRGKVSGEYVGIKAELETQLTNKLNISHDQSRQEMSQETVTEKIIIPAWKSVSLVKKESITDFKQKIRMHCTMDAKIRINAGFEKLFESLRSFELYLKGGGGGSGNAPSLDEFVNRRLITNFHIEKPVLTVERDREYNDSKTTSVERTEVDCK